MMRTGRGGSTKLVDAGIRAAPCHREEHRPVYRGMTITRHFHENGNPGKGACHAPPQEIASPGFHRDRK